MDLVVNGRGVREETQFTWSGAPGGRYLHVRVIGAWPDDEQMREARRLLLAEGVWRPSLGVLLDLRDVVANAPPPTVAEFAQRSRDWDEAAGPPARVAVLTTEGMRGAGERYLEAAQTYGLPASMVHFVGHADAVSWLRQSTALPGERLPSASALTADGATSGDVWVLYKGDRRVALRRRAHALGLELVLEIDGRPRYTAIARTVAESRTEADRLCSNLLDRGWLTRSAGAG